MLDKPLPEKPRLSQFHLGPCRAGDGEFADYSVPDRDRVTYLFRQIILESKLISFAAAVNGQAWRDLVSEEVSDELGDPLNLCFVKCVDNIIKLGRIAEPGEKITFIFDQGISRQLIDMAQLYLSQKDRYPEIAGIGFGTVAEVLPLQGADMIATETTQYGRSWLNGKGDQPNPHFKDFQFRDLSVGLVFDRDQIREMVERVHHMRATAKALLTTPFQKQVF